MRLVDGEQADADAVAEVGEVGRVQAFGCDVEDAQFAGQARPYTSARSVSLSPESMSAAGMPRDRRCRTWSRMSALNGVTTRVNVPGLAAGSW